MIYRVRMKVSYNERWFEFDNIQEASFFAETILTHQVQSDDHRDRQTYVSIEVVDRKLESEDE